ncbi:hypothetical protein [Actinomycetospora sp. NBRC 106378]|uniref:hypothetical protein n=1 Tax=Actinomycetospora sp. NBRC 106378 TaxID=3032208 RepID=UPI0024A55019|nr:hypothetical protein [Actinomycetospora sp. NBRC 106378]GLZ51160.1 hypothetical protein Acsp07_07770 [Actinomycetospora sp. NBRC 106378]
MLVAVLIPLILLIAAVLLERFESRVLDVPTRRRPVRPPMRLEAPATAPVAQRHLQAVPEPLVVDVVPAEVTDRPLPKAS